MRDLLLTDHPANAVHNIAFSATIGAYNTGDIFVEVYKGLVGKAFKALDFQRF